VKKIPCGRIFDMEKSVLLSYNPPEKGEGVGER